MILETRRTKAPLPRARRPRVPLRSVLLAAAVIALVAPAGLAADRVVLAEDFTSFG